MNVGVILFWKEFSATCTQIARIFLYPKNAMFKRKSLPVKFLILVENQPIFIGPNSRYVRARQNPS